MNSMYFSNEQLDWLKHFLSFLFWIKYLESSQTLTKSPVNTEIA